MKTIEFYGNRSDGRLRIETHGGAIEISIGWIADGITEIKIIPQQEYKSGSTWDLIGTANNRLIEKEQPCK